MLNLRYFILSSFISKNVVMQRIIRSFCLVVFLFGSKSIYAQQPALGCDDKAMRIQSQQLKHDFASQGLSVYKDAMISMESHQPFPVAVQLDKGKLYQLIFIGSRDAKKISMELFDGADKKIDERIIKKPKEQNFVVYSFTPEKTDMYLLVFTQIKGSKSMCGSFSIMQPGGEGVQQTPPATPANNKPATANPRYVPRKK